MKILIVDDIKENIYMLETLLTGKGYEVISARNGVEALEKLKKGFVDIIVSDILMPKMDGFQLCRECKRDETLRKIPLVFYTATYTDKKDEEFALSLGAERFIVKPMEHERFMEIIEEILKDYKKGLLQPLMLASEIPPEEETVGYMKEYSERLIKKLEDKMLDLEKTKKEIEDYSKLLEQKVEKRTKKLTMTNKHLEKANRAKSEFLATMSHELRTPLNSVIGFAEVLQDEKFGPLTKKQARYVNNILTSGRHLLGLITDILDLAKVESGKMELALSEFSFPELIESIKIVLKEMAFRKNISIESRIASEISTVNADQKKIKQIIYNLLSNAIKFTPDGGKVNIKANIKNGKLWVSVADTGVGIKEEDMDKLFKVFQQIDNEYTQKYGGTGLGLFLTKKLVELHGGKIWAESEFGKGSTFTLTIPLRKNKA